MDFENSTSKFSVPKSQTQNVISPFTCRATLHFETIEYNKNKTKILNYKISILTRIIVLYFLTQNLFDVILLFAIIFSLLFTFLKPPSEIEHGFRICEETP